MIHKTLVFSIVVLLGFISGTVGFGLDFGSSDSKDNSEDQVEGRFFFFLGNNNGGNAINLNATVLAALAAALASAFMSLLNLAALGLLLAEELKDKEKKKTHIHHDSGYASYRR